MYGSTLRNEAMEQVSITGMMIFLEVRMRIHYKNQIGIVAIMPFLEIK